jgi:hypothetical protein
MKPVTTGMFLGLYMLQDKRFRTWGSMFSRSKDLEKVRVGSLLSVVANTGLG